MTPALSDPLATPRAQRLYALLLQEQGRRILLAQQESPGRMRHDQEMDYLLSVTDDLPALRGLDFIHNDFAGCVDRALRWNDRGGAVTLCWHTGVEGIGYPESQAETPDFDALLLPSSPLHGRLMRRWDEAAAALKRLQDADVPVLWRPFHEFDGRWFWWGKAGGEAFIALWRMMRRYFTDVHGLHNLIWVLGYADDVQDGWYPGDAYCDVMGADTYKGVTVQEKAWGRLKALNPHLPLAYHECGVIPPVDDFFQKNVAWSWIMPWHGRWLMENNPADSLKRIYADERMITLSRMPAF